MKAEKVSAAGIWLTETKANKVRNLRWLCPRIPESKIDADITDIYHTDVHAAFHSKFHTEISSAA